MVAILERFVRIARAGESMTPEAAKPTPARTKMLVLAGMTLLLATALGWGGGILYWHFTLRSAFRTFEESSAPGGPPSQDESNLAALEILRDGGCRSLPLFVQGLDPAKPIQFLQASTEFIARYDDSEAFEIITSLDAEPTRRLKCEKIRAWWRDHGGRVHQAWRFWSARCGDQDQD
jgi:hypothetical protein